MVVRAEDEGFYARLYPSPRPDWRALLGGAAVFGGVGVGIAAVLAEQPEVRTWIVASSLLFGALLYGFAFGAGFFPVEIRADDSVLYWGGERYPWSRVGACVADGGRLELRSPEGTALARVDHLRPEVARWIALAVTASLPTDLR